jgi:uncharacterized membrane protein YeaQ/YmgE (transglycosylase-associated protein family)
MMKNVLTTIGIGLLIGVVARILVKGTGSMELIGTIIVGILGSLLGGWIGKKVGKPVTRGKLDWRNFGFSVLGAVILLIICRAFGWIS